MTIYNAMKDEPESVAACPPKPRRPRWHSFRCSGRIPVGREDISAFDRFAEDRMSKGGEKWTEEVNEWYAALER